MIYLHKCPGTQSKKEKKKRERCREEHKAELVRVTRHSCIDGSFEVLFVVACVVDRSLT